MALGGVLDRLRSLQDGPTPSEGRLAGGQGEIEGASLTAHGPWGAPLIKDID